ncbi:Hypothetical_protein [Hexamita inflata]|uniref:Hypothetical_protein n=1 Tax=Hexamita inflata TaxID=28002 RepID=A0AA86P5S5_9EUKA|nr:Hypothetical protein HINF_LOCUS19013 [Hexamita inflata]
MENLSLSALNLSWAKNLSPLKSQKVNNTNLQKYLNDKTRIECYSNPKQFLENIQQYKISQQIVSQAISDLLGTGPIQCYVVNSIGNRAIRSKLTYLEHNNFMLGIETVQLTDFKVISTESTQFQHLLEKISINKKVIELQLNEQIILVEYDIALPLIYNICIILFNNCDISASALNISEQVNSQNEEQQQQTDYLAVQANSLNNMFVHIITLEVSIQKYVDAVKTINKIYDKLIVLQKNKAQDGKLQWSVKNNQLVVSINDQPEQILQQIKPMHKTTLIDVFNDLELDFDVFQLGVTLQLDSHVNVLMNKQMCMEMCYNLCVILKYFNKYTTNQILESPDAEVCLFEILEVNSNARKQRLAQSRLKDEIVRSQPVFTFNTPQAPSPTVKKPEMKIKPKRSKQRKTKEVSEEVLEEVSEVSSSKESTPVDMSLFQPLATVRLEQASQFDVTAMKQLITTHLLSKPDLFEHDLQQFQRMRFKMNNKKVQFTLSKNQQLIATTFKFCRPQRIFFTDFYAKSNCVNLIQDEDTVLAPVDNPEEFNVIVFGLNLLQIARLKGFTVEKSKNVSDLSIDKAGQMNAQMIEKAIKNSKKDFSEDLKKFLKMKFIVNGKKLSFFREYYYLVAQTVKMNECMPDTRLIHFQNYVIDYEQLIVDLETEGGMIRARLDPGQFETVIFGLTLLSMGDVQEE